MKQCRIFSLPKYNVISCFFRIVLSAVVLSSSLACAPALPAGETERVTADALRRSEERMSDARSAAEAAEAAAARSAAAFKEAQALLAEARLLKSRCDAALNEEKKLQAKRKIIRRPKVPVVAQAEAVTTTTVPTTTTTLPEPEYSPSDAPVVHGQ